MDLLYVIYAGSFNPPKNANGRVSDKYISKELAKMQLDFTLRINCSKLLCRTAKGNARKGAVDQLGAVASRTASVQWINLVQWRVVQRLCCILYAGSLTLIRTHDRLQAAYNLQRAAYKSTDINVN